MSKKRWLRRGMFVILLLLAFFHNRYSYPFQIGSPATEPWHENIVNSAFADFVANGISLGCLNDIIDGNRYCDIAIPNEKAYHWSVEDRNDVSWNSSAAEIQTELTYAKNYLMNGVYDLAKKNFGIATHTIADFFSHSNWVENKGNSIDGLAFVYGGMPVDFPWVTKHTTYPAKCLEKDYPGDEGGADAFYNAFYAAISMTKKEYYDFERDLFNSYSKNDVYNRLIGFGITPTLVFYQWPELKSVQKIDDTQRISWNHIGIKPDTQVSISLYKNGVLLGYVAEVPLKSKEFYWQVGSYYLKNGTEKVWYKVNEYESNALYRIRITSDDWPDAKASSYEFEIQNFVFTNPNKGDELLKNQIVDITWLASDFPVGADLFLYKGSSKIYQIATVSDLSTVKTISWNTGELALGIDYEIRIQFKAYAEPPYALYQKFNTSTGDFKIALPKIEGYVRYANGNGVPNVRMYGLPSEPLTNSNGYYKDYVNYGWSGSVGPVKDGYNIIPGGKGYSNVLTNQTKQNYLAKINITGYVRTAGGAGIDGVRIFDLPPGSITGSDGSYWGSVDYGWDGSVTPSKPGYVFSPASRNYTDVTTPKTNQNFTGTACTYAISPTSATVPAAGGSGSIQVTSPTGCAWTASSNRTWITITSGASGKGNGTVQYKVAANTSGASRSGSISVEGKTFSITQQK